MAADLILGLARASLAASAAIIAVLLLRKPARRLVGAQIAYGLWIAPLLAALCSLTPAPAEVTLISRLDGFDWPTVAPDQARLVGGLWLLGFVATLALMTLAQARFARRMRRGTSGPALVGVLAPRIVAPRDFAQRFSLAERKVIRAHEQAHLDRQDSRANAAMALFQAVNWFNPLVHLAVRAARADQELACDAAVIARYPRERRRYAQALLSSQLGDDAAPLACHWPAPAVHPLEERIGLLAAATPGLKRQAAGLAALSVFVLAISWGAWAAQTPAPEQQRYVYHTARTVTYVDMAPEG